MVLNLSFKTGAAKYITKSSLGGCGAVQRDYERIAAGLGRCGGKKLTSKRSPQTGPQKACKSPKRDDNHEKV